jgi:hypothetical protein
MFRDRRSPAEVLRELRLPRPERDAARAERHVEREIRRQRDNDEAAWRRAAAVDAEARRNKDAHFPG